LHQDALKARPTDGILSPYLLLVSFNEENGGSVAVAARLRPCIAPGFEPSVAHQPTGNLESEPEAQRSVIEDIDAESDSNPEA
jgi:hypothetical protein